MRKLLVGIGVVVALLILAAVAVTFLVPFDTYKPQIVARVKEATGRDLRIDGPIRLSLVPRLALELGEVGISSGPDAGAGEVVSLKELRLVLKLIPLLSGQLEVDSFVLDHPVIALETDKQGKSNWVFGEGLTKAREAPETGDSGPLSLRNVQNLRIIDGTVSWLDRRSGTSEQFSDVSLAISLASLDEPLEAEGELTWKARAVSVDIRVAKPRALFEGGTSPVTARIDAETIELRYAGDVGNITPIKVDGDIDLDVPSIRSLAAWVGSPIEAAGKTLGPLRIKGRLALAGAEATFADARIAIDAIEATGNLHVDAGGATPRIGGKLAIERLDLDPYLSADDAGAGQAAAKNASPGWSEERIDLSALQAVDADLGLSVAALQAGEIRLSNSALATKLTNGRLSVELTQFTMDKGNGSGKVMLDGSHADFTGVAVSLDLAGFDAESLLRDVAGFDRISGTGVLDVSLATRGNSERQLMESIQGKGRIDLRDGAIKGINLVAMVLHVASAFTAGDASARTDFSAMGGSFTVSRGVVTNNDMALESPLLKVTGAGNVDLGQKTVDYRITPKVVTPLVGQLGLGTPGVMVPVLVRGPWSNLRYEPDLAGMIRGDLEAPVDILEGVVKFPGALLGDEKPKEPSGEKKPDSAPTKAVDALKGLFGR